VHCVQGISRSASVVLAYLIKYEGMSTDAAVALVKRRRGIANPNAGFLRQLRAYESALCSRVCTQVSVCSARDDLDPIVNVGIRVLDLSACQKQQQPSFDAALGADRQIEAAQLEKQSLFHMRRFWRERDALISTRIECVDDGGVALCIDVQPPPIPLPLRIDMGMAEASSEKQ
jgi:hypothetical protein